MADTPNFAYEGITTPIASTDPIYVLYSCIQLALGAPVTMDDARQSKENRRKSKKKVKDDTNASINMQAANMTKCIVNYMASSADSTIIDYEFDFELENVLVTSDFNADGWATGVSGDEEGTTYMDATSDESTDYGAGEFQFAFGEDSSYDIDLDWDIYEEIHYVGAPLSTINFTFS